MFNCTQCVKTFSSQRGLNGHMRLHGQSNGTYSVQRVKKIPKNRGELFNCLQCGIEKVYYPSTSFGKYCSQQCRIDYQWNVETKQRIESGECTHNSVTILKRYLKEIRGDKCEICKHPPIWNGKPLVLQLDHINGDSANNHPNNLRLVCPNCHTQTDTFTSKGFGNKGKKDTRRNALNRDRYNATIMLNTQ